MVVVNCGLRGGTQGSEPGSGSRGFGALEASELIKWKWTSGYGLLACWPLTIHLPRAALGAVVVATVGVAAAATAAAADPAPAPAWSLFDAAACCARCGGDEMMKDVEPKHSKY